MEEGGEVGEGGDEDYACEAGVGRGWFGPDVCYCRGEGRGVRRCEVESACGGDSGAEGLA